MKQLSYNKEVRIATAQLLDVFNDVYVEREENGAVSKSILVPCVYGARSRILKSAENRNKTLKPPIIVISIVNLSRDTSRVHSVNDNLLLDMDGIQNLKNKVAVPINITYEISILTKFQDDMDQILSNFIVHFNPDIYVIWNHPLINHGTLKSQVVWDSSLQLEYLQEITEDRPWRIISSGQFTYKTWFFPGTSHTGYDSPTLIKNININEYANDAYNKWYSIPPTMDIDEYLDNASSGLISPENYDKLSILESLSSNYFINHYVISGNTIIYPTTSGALEQLINSDNSIQIYSSNQNLAVSAGVNINISNFTSGVYKDIWNEMLTGNLQNIYFEI